MRFAGMNQGTPCDEYGDPIDTESARLPIVQVRPRHENDRCQNLHGLDAAAKPIKCGHPATMQVDGTPYCDHHATNIMEFVCGRPVKIRRKRA